MTPEERQAEALARWLAGPRGAPPPDDLDPEVVAAVLCLQTERIPAPRVTADEILASVTEGPLALTTAGAAPVTAAAPLAGAAPSPAGAASLAPDLVTDLSQPANTPMPARRSPWLRVAFGGGAVAVLSAAAILLVVLPTLRSRAPEVAQTGSEAEVSFAPAPSAPMRDASRSAAEPVDPAAPAVAARPPSTRSGLEEQARVGSGGITSGRGAPSGASAGDALGGGASSTAASGRSAAARPAPAPTASRTIEAPTEQDAVADLDDAKLDEPAAGPAPGYLEAEPDPSPRAAESRAPAPTSDNLAAAKAEATADRARDRKDARARAESAPAAAPPPDAAPAVEDLPLPPTETSARPRGPLSAVAIEPKRVLDEGAVARALGLCDARLGVPGPTPQERADLLWVKGLALWRLGRAADADAAFAEATRLR